MDGFVGFVTAVHPWSGAWEVRKLCPWRISQESGLVILEAICNGPSKKKGPHTYLSFTTQNTSILGELRSISRVAWGFWVSHILTLCLFTFLFMWKVASALKPFRKNFCTVLHEICISSPSLRIDFLGLQTKAALTVSTTSSETAECQECPFLASQMHPFSRKSLCHFKMNL